MGFPQMVGRVISILAPYIHRSIVSKLANSPTFQHLAVTGTEAAEKTAKNAAEGLRKSAIYRTASYKAQEQMTKLKNSEIFIDAKGSSGAQRLSDVKDNLLKELRKNKII
mmetsp:Transcript_67757/g.141255  ORF Transcript_67757/g.141255 Transcript_67757/m.141255 type:complete len:110 (+) Transcript_67757:50-379(+)